MRQANNHILFINRPTLMNRQQTAINQNRIEIVFNPLLQYHDRIIEQYQNEQNKAIKLCFTSIGIAVIIGLTLLFTT